MKFVFGRDSRAGSGSNQAKAAPNVGQNVTGIQTERHFTDAEAKVARALGDRQAISPLDTQYKQMHAQRGPCLS